MRRGGGASRPPALRRRIRQLALGVVALVALCLGCGAATTNGPGSTGAASEPDPFIGSTPTPLAAPAIDLGLRTTDQRWIELSELRGQCTLLFLFATFDGASQASLRPLNAFVGAHPEVHVVGVAVEQSPAELADAWQHALSPSFPIAYDPSGAVLEGSSTLGDIESVPRLRLLDADGRSVAEHVGYPDQGALEAILSATHCPAP